MSLWIKDLYLIRVPNLALTLNFSFLNFCCTKIKFPTESIPRVRKHINSGVSSVECK